jgi:DNA-directed RNA polymerase specialized sigma24 family protein
MKLSANDRKIVHRELGIAQDALTAARGSNTALELLAELTAAIETLTATQHELVNLLLDHGASWSTIADALCTSSAAAKRRYPRRGSRRVLLK